MTRNTRRARVLYQGMAYSLLLAVAILGLGGVGFWLIDPRIETLTDGLWLAFTTAATVGYGDHVPSTLGSKLFSVGVVLLGLAVLSLVTASLSALLLQREVQAEERQIERDLLREIHRLQQQVQALHQEVQALRPGQTPDQGPQ
ncbi:MAG: pH-gated potassium channel KcsA [Pseudomonadota bacterium]|jgi:voltage-gated potassium channel